jgi:hypothetical protein
LCSAFFLPSFISFLVFRSVISLDAAGYEEPWFLMARTERAVIGTWQYQETHGSCYDKRVDACITEAEEFAAFTL